MRVEFIGGPLDGDTADLDDTTRYYRIPLARPIEVWPGPDEVTVLLGLLDSIFRYGEYSPRGNPREFIWRGEP